MAWEIVVFVLMILLLIFFILSFIVKMLKKIPLILRIIGIMIVLVYLLNIFGLMALLNEPLNKMVAGTPDKKCVVDSDCKLTWTNCNHYSCGCGVAVNKDWNTYCPFVYRGLLDYGVACQVYCVHAKAICTDGQCAFVQNVT